MAYSQSVNKSQIHVPTNCHLCDTEKNIKWKCIDCELFMCDKCKEERHFRIKNAQDHKVINIKDGLCNEELDFTNIQCPYHTSKSCCLFCKRCDSLVCPTCVSEVHINHVYDLIEIRNAYNIKIDRLKQGQSKIKMEKEKAITRKKHLEQHKNAEIVKHRKIIQNILNHGNMLKRTIDKYIQKLKNEIDENLKTVLKSTDTDIHIVSKSMRHVYEKYNEVGNFLKTRDIAKFFSNIRKIENSMEVTAPKSQSLYNSTPIFYPGEINQSNVGVLQMPEELSVAFDIIQEYQTELSAVSDLISYADDSIWINSALDNCVVKAEPKGKQLNVFSTLNLAVFGMAISPSNNLLLSVGKSRLQQLSISTGKLSDTVYNVKPLASTIIHITSSNKVIVGGVNEKLGRRAVFVMNEKGDHETVYEYDQHNQPIFTYPRSITSISTGNIHVVDREPGQEGRVVVLAPGSDIINSYIGHPKINKHKSFKPNRIVTTQRDNVMVTEMNTNTIHILDSTGNLVSWYNTTDIGILHPVSLSFTQTGQIYIGCGAEEGHTAKEAKIYKVTTSGC